MIILKGEGMRAKKEKMTMKERLELFRDRVEVLRTTNLMKKGFKYTFTIAFGEKLGGVKITGFEEDELRSYLMTFRHFVLKNSPVYLNKIYNNLRKNVTDDEVKKMLNRNRDHWLQIHRQGVMGLTYDKKNITPEFTVNLFITGEYFHLNGDEREFLKNLSYPWNMYFKHQFIDFLVKATKHIRFIDSIIAKVLKENLLIDEKLNPPKPKSPKALD